MICPKCHTINEDSEKFCKNCGFQLNSARICPECGKTNDSNSKYCKECGTVLTPVNTFRKQLIEENTKSSFFSMYKVPIICALLIILAVGAVAGMAFFNGNSGGDDGLDTIIPTDNGTGFLFDDNPTQAEMQENATNKTNQTNQTMNQTNDTNKSKTLTEKVNNTTDQAKKANQTKVNKTKSKINNSTKTITEKVENKTNPIKNKTKTDTNTDNGSNKKDNKSNANNKSPDKSSDKSNDQTSDKSKDKSSDKGGNSIFPIDNKDNDKISPGIIDIDDEINDSADDLDDNDTDDLSDNDTDDVLNDSADDNDLFGEDTDDSLNDTEDNDTDNDTEDEISDIDMEDVPNLALKVSQTGYSFSTIEYDGKELSNSQCIYIFSEYLLNVKNGRSSSIEIKDVSQASNPSGDDSSQTIEKSDYLSVADRVHSWINSQNSVPNYVGVSEVGPADLSPKKMLELFTSAILDYSVSGELPESVDI